MKAITALQSADRVSQYATQIAQTVNTLRAINHAVTLPFDNNDPLVVILKNKNKNLNEVVAAVNSNKNSSPESFDDIELY